MTVSDPVPSEETDETEAVRQLMAQYPDGAERLLKALREEGEGDD